MRRFAILLACMALAGCGAKEQWKAWVYPDRNDMSQSIMIGYFDTFDQCQAAAIDGLTTLHANEAGDYECGFKCRPREDLNGLEVCKDTRK